ncbi:2-oxoglutarate ferredoxin oxidoreductase subunit gamma [Candidatus Omnitrophus magneticus]|uniref:2-oxoglutarate ferredoxin oxidoreductase subunit gamma n=1 Tax=Candidatus Omnitrophus magneticus TaxID=1609969 RepID=A0A0F0CLZ8_9BACT|nr:2-oxoglutarate ferredoxin oxidoreductase subunit gamma [Candidatus Omnitrophus magneticus]
MKNNINDSIICAGFGGQGVMILGKFLANAGIKENLNVTWLPSYGIEVRGGTAYSSIRINSDHIATPVVNFPNTAIIMNEPSLIKFEEKIEPRGFLILNSSMNKAAVKRKDINVLSIFLTDEALELGNIKVANMIAAGIYAAIRKMFKKDTLLKVIEEMAGGHEELTLINIKAIERGMEIGEEYINRQTKPVIIF